MLKKPNRNENPWRAAGLVSVIGADFVVCLLLGYFIGKYVSNLFGGSIGWVAGGIFLGLAVAVISTIFMIKKLLEDTNEG
ncbi:AtpZ/AtpI family protein [Paenibacillus senegalensis]|uniref:AtpZ/AtpI family protein n=1 Tax=Paenibacillus senegalensis TaxID=1465766 RepID=UPI000287F4BC|nr:AtpZ/AtpI family protein [Paenibacillus senegalensis]